MSNLRDPFAEGATPPPPPRPKAVIPAPLHVGLRHPSPALVFAAVLGVGLLCGLCGTLVGYLLIHHGGEEPAAGARFVPIGRAYRAELARVYARSWEDGAKLLDAGQAPEAALDTVAKAWDAGRVKLFERLVTPELARVVPEGKSAKDVTTEDRAALAAAWRGFAKGLEGGR